MARSRVHSTLCRALDRLHRVMSVPDLTDEIEWTDDEIATGLERLSVSLGLALRIEGEPGFWHGRFFQDEAHTPWGHRVFFSRARKQVEARRDIYGQFVDVLGHIFGDASADNGSSAHH
ncbi:hypothetical protein IM511_11640 [Erythrobacteraceae bacterium E2-1 Yellow Sea]|nr:hypothetical protein [Erythrobacteraceae bacterium E2-1 Yellow Sea]